MNNYFVDDICNKNSNVIFILESPHKEEIKYGIPLLGDSGIIFSQALLPNKIKAAGYQVKDGIVPFSIMNTFQNALQLSPEMSGINSAIGQLEFSRLGLAEYKKQVLRIIISDSKISYLLESYTNRIKQLVELASKNPKIVVCGIIAQVFFEYALNISRIHFGKASFIKFDEKEINLLYVEHPSPKNSNTHWTPVNNNEKYHTLTNFLST